MATPPLPIILIAGGRDFEVGRAERVWLDGIHAMGRFQLVVHGGAAGADAGGAAWAQDRGLAVQVFPADWQALGVRAGPIRNRRMAEFLRKHHHARNRVVLFPGGRGTASMRACAVDAGIRVIDYLLRENG